jgi:hypothetical protein
MVLTVSFALSLVTGLVCHHRKRNAQALSLLDASVGASGPHDFTVRVGTFRQPRHPRPSHPAPNVRDDREAPLKWDGIAADVEVIWAKREVENFFGEDWTGGIALIARENFFSGVILGRALREL